MAVMKVMQIKLKMQLRTLERGKDLTQPISWLGELVTAARSPDLVAILEARVSSNSQVSIRIIFNAWEAKVGNVYNKLVDQSQNSEVDKDPSHASREVMFPLR